MRVRYVPPDALCPDLAARRMPDQKGPGMSASETELAPGPRTALAGLRRRPVHQRRCGTFSTARRVQWHAKAPGVSTRHRGPSRNDVSERPRPIVVHHAPPAQEDPAKTPTHHTLAYPQRSARRSRAPPPTTSQPPKFSRRNGVTRGHERLSCSPARTSATTGRPGRGWSSTSGCWRASWRSPKAAARTRSGPGTACVCGRGTGHGSAARALIRSATLTGTPCANQPLHGVLAPHRATSPPPAKITAQRQALSTT